MLLRRWNTIKKTIDRIGSLEHIQYWGKKPPEKRLVLEMPEFDREA